MKSSEQNFTYRIFAIDRPGGEKFLALHNS